MWEPTTLAIYAICVVQIIGGLVFTAIYPELPFVKHNGIAYQFGLDPADINDFAPLFIAITTVVLTYAVRFQYYGGFFFRYSVWAYRIFQGFFTCLIVIYLGSLLSVTLIFHLSVQFFGVLSFYVISTVLAAILMVVVLVRQKRDYLNLMYETKELNLRRNGLELSEEQTDFLVKYQYYKQRSQKIHKTLETKKWAWRRVSAYLFAGDFAPFDYYNLMKYLYLLEQQPETESSIQQIQWITDRLVLFNLNEKKRMMLNKLAQNNNLLMPEQLNDKVEVNSDQSV